MALDYAYVVLAQQMRDAGRELFRHRPRALHHFIEIEPRIIRRETKMAEPMEQVVDFRGAQQGFRRYTAPIQPNPAEMLALDNGGVHTELSRPDGGDITAGSAA